MRVLGLRRPEQDALLRLVVRCENGKHGPIRVFMLGEGLLVQCQSDADIGGRQGAPPSGRRWSPRRAFFLEEWLSQPAEILDRSHLQVICECDQTHPRSVDVQKIAAAVPAEGRRNTSLPEVAP